jgi:hypothetical protein
MMAAEIAAAVPTDADVTGRAPDAFGRAGSVVLGDVIAARAVTPSPVGALGGASRLTAGWLSFGSTMSGDTKMRTVFAEPSVDVFVARGFSLGALIGGGVTSWETSTPGIDGASSMEQWHLTAMPRIGESLDLTNDIAMWPRFAAGVALSDGPGQDKLGVAVRATFDVPFVFRLTRHVLLQAGPQVSYLNQVSGQPDLRGFSGGASAGLSIVL